MIGFEFLTFWQQCGEGIEERGRVEIIRPVRKLL